MEAPRSIIESLVDKGAVYSKTSLELAKLKSLETTTVVVSALISKLGVILSIALFLLVLNLGIALWLGDLLGKSYYGFFIVAAFYLLAGIFLQIFLHRWIKQPISELIITQALQ